MNFKNFIKKSLLYKLLIKYRKGHLYFYEYKKRRRIVEKESPAALIKYVWNKRRKGFPLNLENPKSYQEKMQWLKLNWYNKLAIQCASKYLVRQYIYDKGLGFLLNDLYGFYKTPEEIDFKNLPDKFVLKPSHDSGHIIICKEKSKLNVKKTKRKLKKWMEVDYQYLSGEWCYSGEKYIVCEKYMENNDKDGLIDYKLFCFNGKFEYLYITLERYNGNKQRIWYNKDWRQLNVEVPGYKSERELVRPKNFDSMIEYAEILATPFPFVRVDFYDVNNKIIFGELTFASDSGFSTYYPTEFEYKLGSKLELPQKSQPTGWEILLNK